MDIAIWWSSTLPIRRPFLLIDLVPPSARSEMPISVSVSLLKKELAGTLDRTHCITLVHRALVCNEYYHNNSFFFTFNRHEYLHSGVMDVSQTAHRMISFDFLLFFFRGFS